MIIISTIENDAIVFEPLEIKTDNANSDFGQAKRRQNRVPTLDGESVLQDRGYSNTDLTFKITASRYNKDEFDALRYLLTAYPVVRMSTRLGSFIGSLANLVDADAKFEFLVTADD